MDESILYNCIHKKLLTKVNYTKLFRKRDLYLYLGRIHKIPKSLIPPLLKELENNGIIKNINKQFVIILPLKKDLEEHVNEVYARLKVF